MEFRVCKNSYIFSRVRCVDLWVKQAERAFLVSRFRLQTLPDWRIEKYFFTSCSIRVYFPKRRFRSWDLKCDLVLPNFFFIFALDITMYALFVVWNLFNKNFSQFYILINSRVNKMEARMLRNIFSLLWSLRFHFLTHGYSSSTPVVVWCGGYSDFVFSNYKFHSSGTAAIWYLLAVSKANFTEQWGYD